MAYIGKSPAVGNFIKLDAITTSATATYNLVNGGVAYSPESVNHMLVSLNGVIQSPTTAFTVSGTQIIFASTLSSSDVIDFIMVYGDVLNLGVPSDATVTDAKITAMAASKLTGALPAISGASLTALNATNIGSGTVPTARLGTGTASSSTVLYGDQTYKAEPSGGLTKLVSTTTADASSAAITFTSTYITTTYDLYLLSGWCIPADDGGYLRIRVQSSGSDDSTADGYGFENNLMGGANHASDNDETYIRTKSNGTYGGTNAGEGWLLNCWISNPLSSSYPTMITGSTNVVQQDGNHEASTFSGCRYVSANNGVTVYWDTGNHDTGSTLTLYGVTK